MNLNLLPWLRSLLGRGGRKEYWIAIGVLFLAQIAANMVMSPAAASLLLALPWIVVLVRRLHDAGRTGWLALGPITVGFLVGFFKGFTTSAGLLTPEAVQPFAIWIPGLFNLALIIWIGAAPGDPKDNRFGMSGEAPTAEADHFS